MNDYLIRPIRKADLPALLHLLAEHAAYERATFSVDEKLHKLSVAIFEQPIRLYCDVVEHNQVLLGYVSYTFDYSTWDAAEFMYMDCLFLKEQARGSGIGRHIMSRLLTIATERGCTNIQWQTPDFNLPAIRFYNRLGAIQKTKARFTLPSNTNMDTPQQQN